MHFSAVLFALAAATSAYAADLTVTVGDNGSLAFSPPSLNVQSGDNVIFEFRAKNHSVTQSSFATPCSPLPGGIDSGFKLVSVTSPPFPQWNVTIVNTSAPMWFYCAQTNPVVHCHSGMVFAINPTPEKSFNAFQLAANSSASDDSGAPIPGPAPSTTGVTPGTNGTAPSASVSAPGASGPTTGATGPAPGVTSAISSGSQPSGTPSTPTSSDDSTASGTSNVIPSDNGSTRMAGSASGSILAIAGLLVGLMY